MEQNIQPNENSAEIKLDSEGEPINSKPEKKVNKKIILLIIIILVIIGFGTAYFLFLNKGDNGKLPTDNDVAVLEDKKEVEIDKELDSDQDGLPDYIEKILGTDINNSDTDGDSYSDFNEIKNGYNPLNDKKYTEEKWGVVKEEIGNEDGRFYEEMFESSVVNSNNTEADDFVCGASVVKDIDGNIYNTVKIGDQCWLKENLKATKNPAGEAITRYCYDNDPSICETDGGLYNWDTAMNGSVTEGDQGICPNGWHIPKDSEWYILESGLAIDSCLSTRYGASCDIAGTKLKTGGTSGFDGVLAGGRTPVSSIKGSHNVHYSGGDYYNRGKTIYLWSSDTMPYPGDLKNMSPIAIYRSMFSSKDSIERSRLSIFFAFSVRCLKD